MEHAKQTIKNEHQSTNQIAVRGRHNSPGNKPRFNACGSFGNETYDANGPIQHPVDAEHRYNPSEFKPT